MDGTTISALFALIGTLTGTFGGILTSTKLTNYRIEQLEKRVEAHNNLASEVIILRDNDKFLESKIDGIAKRLDGLENRGGDK